MKFIFQNARVNIKFDSTKFNDLSYSEKGLIIKIKNKPEREISFEEVENVFIKKHELTPIVEAAFIASPFLLIHMAFLYSPFEILTLASFFTIPPVFIVVHKYKWYRLYVRLKDGNILKKKVPLNAISENFNFVASFYREYFKINRLES